MQPAGRLPVQDWMQAPDARAVLAALTAGGGTARFVGGCVRDSLLGRPVVDIDIAVDRTPEENLQALANAGIHTIPTGLKHGTVIAVTPARHFEITALRVDVETYGRHAKVAFTDDWAGDARRRDFTMNALFADADGTLYDPTGGVADLHAGHVRFVGEPARRIDEDYLRVLRFFRFHAWYGRSEPDAAALTACAAAAGKLAQLSGERIRSEMLRLLMAEAPLESLRLMAETGVLVQVLPDGSDLGALARLITLDPAPDALRRLAALMCGGGDAVRRLARHWHLANAQRDRLLAMRAPPLDIVAAGDAGRLRQAVYRVGAALAADLALLAGRADLAELCRLAQVPAFPLAGRDLLARGVPSGPGMGKLLRELEDWWLDQDLAPDRAALLAELDRRTRD